MGAPRMHDALLAHQEIGGNLIEVYLGLAFVCPGLTLIFSISNLSFIQFPPSKDYCVPIHISAYFILSYPSRSITTFTSSR